ncbi:hypothetical protein FC36_GL000062 [Ligilactobacillus equi DSM 15833 = JCM 10991]|uniref:Phage shock protein PspC N-terminal domain-containing protein n=1 Tax=Ligilactobacillus equi DSM 15833 = JCM 10991 TaxID=1423740 RepID=A0A0R1TNR0_9LACO|nr:hypothetical protein FC36_GL000062 [Ligilactobacillus equi DSM 15833 = JCM 10991]
MSIKIKEEKTMAKKKLMKSNDRIVSGVFGGIAEYFGWEKTLTRLVGAVLIIFPGNVFLGILLYVVAAMVMPDKAGYDDNREEDETIIEGEFKPKGK